MELTEAIPDGSNASSPASSAAPVLEPVAVVDMSSRGSSPMPFPVMPPPTAEPQANLSSLIPLVADVYFFLARNPDAVLCLEDMHKWLAIVVVSMFKTLQGSTFVKDCWKTVSLHDSVFSFCTLIILFSATVCLMTSYKFGVHMH